MKTICFYFQIHQPFRLKRYRFFDIGNDHYYYDDFQNEEIIRRIAEQCYLPANRTILEMIKTSGGKFKVAFSISGVALEQMEIYTPEVIDSFKELAATGNVEFLSETYLRGVYNPSGTSLYELAENVLIDANLPLAVDGLNRWVIDESLRDIYTTAPLPASPRSECLEMIANAGKCVIYTDRVGTLHIEKRDYEITDYVINDFNSYSRTEVSLTKPLSQVEVKCYTYFPEDGESREIYKGTLDVNGIETYIFAYSTPSADAQATVTGGEIIEATYYTNACWLTVEGTGSVDVSIIGHELKNSESTVIVIADDPTGEMQAVENPLITSSDVAKGIGNWVKEFYANRKTFSSDFRIDPRLDALDVVRISNPFSENDVLLTDVNIDFTGAFKGKTEGRAV